MTKMALRKQKEPEDYSCSQSDSNSAGSSSSVAAIITLGVSVSSNKTNATNSPLHARIAGSHGSDCFLVCVDEIGLAQAAGSPTGDSIESVLIGGGRAFRVGVRWMEDEDDADRKEWDALSKLGNGHKFCDEDGDLDPDIVGIPADVWQLAYGKIVTPIPAEDRSSTEEEKAP